MPVQIKISTRHGQILDSAHALIREKAEKLLHFFDRISMIEVTVDVQHKDEKHVEIQVNAEHKHDFVAQHHAEELQAAVDGAIDKLKHQLTRYKEKIQDHRRDPSHNDTGTTLR
jgi:putative sigma-54 modulation protein